MKSLKKLARLGLVTAWACMGCATFAVNAPSNGESGKQQPSQASDNPEQKPASPTLFDSARHMRVAEVKPGMKGYGLSVFRGTKIEKFDVEVISILKNFNPKFDVVLIKFSGQNLERIGPIAGMSGSPIFLKDESGRERMIGAFAYGWPFQKESIAGVQPIEYMLGLPQASKEAPITGGSEDDGGTSASTDAAGVPKARGRITWDLRNVLAQPEFAGLDSPLTPKKLAVEQNPRALTGGGDVDSNRMQPLATPLMSAGVSAKTLDDFAPLLRMYGLTALQGGGAGGSASGETNAAPIAPGSVLAAPLLLGDSELSAVGTCTEVIGDTFVGFGHSFNNEGKIELPVASGEVQAVVSKLDQSFKLGAMTKLRGALTADRVVGVGGKLGDVPAMIPIDIRVHYADGSNDQTYHFKAARHPKFTPLLAGIAMNAAVSSLRDLPQYHTVDYKLTVDFANGKKIELNNTAVNIHPVMLYMELGLPMAAAAENPFERVPVEKVSGTITVTPVAREAEVLSVNVPKLKYRPGETVKGYVTYRPFRAAETVLPFEMDLPRDLPNGQYQLVISDWKRYLSDEAQAEPFRFQAESSGEVFAVLKDFTSIRHNALYVRMLRQSDGVAVGRVAMPRLPSSRRQVMLGAGRSNTSPFVSSTVKTLPTEYVMEGSADFVLTIDSEAHVEVGGPPRGPAGAGVQKTDNSTPQTAANPTEEKNDKSKPNKPAEKPEKPDSNTPEAPDQPK
jgi:hypothetical protein